jgi:hypothetical protein
MKKLLIFLFFINITGLNLLYAQEESLDSISQEDKYGIRIGIDVMNPIISLFDSNTMGLDFVGDIRFMRNYYAAIELGFNEKTKNEDYFSFSSKGSYIKVGINYNAYKNWVGMRNEIYMGARYGFSFFEQTLNSYVINQHGTYFEPLPNEINTNFNDLTAQWIELVFGIKVETLNNLFLGMGIRFNRMISFTAPENFANLYVPGFNRVYSNDVGVGFNYTITYFIPLLKKSR